MSVDAHEPMEVLQNLTEKQSETIEAFSKIRNFNGGDFLFHEGEIADRLFLIKSGNVEVEIYIPGRGHVTIESLKSGDVLGWSWLVPPFRWHFNARAAGPTQVLEIDAGRLRRECEADHSLGYHLYKEFSLLMSKRLQSTRLHLMGVYGEKQDW